MLGQTVLFDGRTVFRGKAAAQVAVGDTVSVSGWYQGNGRFRASLVRVGVPVDAQAPAELEGVLKNLDSGARTFFIGGLKVDYNNAAVALEDDQTALAEGTWVEVEGTLNAGVLMASEVDADDDRLDAAAGDDIELEGPIGARNSDGSLVINGITVRLGDVEFDDGLNASALQEGLYVKVEGEWNAAGEVVAEEIESRDANAQVDAAVLGAPDRANQRLDVGGVTVQVTDLTLIIDDDATGNLTFADLKEGDALEVDGLQRTRADGSTYIEALKIERDQDDNDAVFELEGRVSAVDANGFTALGVVLNVDASTRYQDGLSGLADIAAGNEVEVEYTRKDGTWFLVSRVEQDD